MRAVVVLCALCACRIGFDELSTAGDDMPPIDASISAHCTATRITGFDYGTGGITDLAAARVSDGYAVGAIRGTSSFYGVHLDSGLAPNAATPILTSPVDDNGTYTNATLYFDGTNLDGGLTVDDGTSYLKTFPQSMNQFLSADQRLGKVGAHSIGRSTSVHRAFWFDATSLHSNTLDNFGLPSTTDFVTYTQGGITDVGVGNGPDVVAIVAHNASACTRVTISDAGVFNGAAFSADCHAPFVTDTGVLYQRTDEMMMWSDGEGTRALIVGESPRLITTSQRWLIYAANGLRAAPLDAPTPVPIDGLPSGPVDAFEVADNYAFAVYGTKLFAITCP
jgi:hypothetical protein